MRVHGVLQDKRTGEPVPFAYVAERNGTAWTTKAQADVMGVFAFDSDAPSLNLKFATIGYAPKFVTKANDGTPITVLMEETATELEPVVVTPKGKGFPWWLLLLPLLARR